jgi:hypothetical protein
MSGAASRTATPQIMPYTRPRIGQAPKIQSSSRSPLPSQNAGPGEGALPGSSAADGASCISGAIAKVAPDIPPTVSAPLLRWPGKGPGSASAGGCFPRLRPRSASRVRCVRGGEMFPRGPRRATGAVKHSPVLWPCNIEARMVASRQAIDRVHDSSVTRVKRPAQKIFQAAGSEPRRA